MSICEVSRYAYLLWFPEHHSTGGLWAALSIANDRVIDVANSSERTGALVITLTGSELRCILDCISDRWGFCTKLAQRDSGDHTKCALNDTIKIVESLFSAELTQIFLQAPYPLCSAEKRVNELHSALTYTPAAFINSRVYFVRSLLCITVGRRSHPISVGIRSFPR